jgi:hypothetical protein
MNRAKAPSPASIGPELPPHLRRPSAAEPPGGPVGAPGGASQPPEQQEGVEPPVVASGGEEGKGPGGKRVLGPQRPTEAPQVSLLGEW